MKYRDKLKTEYPKILGNYGRGRFIEIGKGWRPHVEKMLNHLRWLADKDGSTISIALIKEKFGGLRVQGVRFSEEASHEFRGIAAAVLWKAEADSTSLCETCGERGQLRGGSWRGTLCDKHHQESLKPDPTGDTV